MVSIRRSGVRWLVAALLVTLVTPSGVLDPDPVAAAAVSRPPDAGSASPAAPGTFRSASSAASTPITSIVVNKPAGTTTNDVLVAAVTVHGTPTITAPAGWTLVRSDVNTTELKQSVYWRAAGGSEPASYTFTFNVPVSATVAGITAYSGVNTTTPIDVSGGQANASSTSITAPSITTTVANTRLVGIFGLDNDATFTPPSGMTERWDVDVQGASDGGSEAADVAKATAGATGTKVATASSAALNIGQLVALKPSGTIAFRAATSAESVPTTNLVLAKPAGTAADDVLLSVISARGALTVTPPAGWAQVRLDVSGTTMSQVIFVRTAGASEPSTYTFTLSKAVTAVVGGLHAYSGLDTLSPIDAHGGQTNASSASVTAPSITTTVADTKLVGFFGTANDATFTPPSGMTERFDVLANGTSKISAEGGDVTQAVAGASGTKVATASKSAANIGQLVALRPVGSVVNLGVQSQHSFESWDLGTGDSLMANVATRNVVISHPLISLPIEGSSVSFGATYNAKDRADVGMGPGWRLDVFRRLRVNADSTVTLTDGSGARHAFTSPSTIGAITTYTRPATLYATLSKDTTPTPDRFTLTYRDLSVDLYDVSGDEALLVREEDRFGNGVNLAYSGATTNLSTITDTAASPDRTIDFLWDTTSAPDHLTRITDWAYISGGVVQTSATGSRREHRFAYDASGYLAGWTNPFNTSNTCPTAASHQTCLAYTAGLVTGVAKKQTYTTESSGTLGSSTRTVTTAIAYSGSDVTSITDAEEQAQGGSAVPTTFTAESSTLLRVDRPTTTSKYDQVGAADAYGRITSVFRKIDVSTSLETRTTWDGTYPIEPATVTENYGALDSTPARTRTYTYQASSMGLVSKVVEPITATDDRWTEFVYNANNDVTKETVSFEGANATVTRSCYEDHDNECETTEDGLAVVRKIEGWVTSVASDSDTNVTTDYAYDGAGQRLSRTTYDIGTDGDARTDTFEYDSKGNLMNEIVNFDDGEVDPDSSDTDPDPATGARTDLTTVHAYDTAGNRVSMADPRWAIAGGATTYAYDDFNRSVSNSWGTAPTGGSWSGTTSDHDINGTVGTISLGSVTNRNAYLTSVSAADTEALVKVRVDTLALDDDHLFWVYLRRQDSSNYYQARVKFTVDGILNTFFSQTAGGVTTTIGQGKSTVPHTTSDWYWMRARISGTTNVLGQIRVWRDGTTEPSGWTVSATDTGAPAALQGSGHVGIRFQLGTNYSGGFPVIASVDDFSVTTIGGGGQGLGANDYVSRTTYDPLDRAITSSTPTTPGVTTATQTSTTTFDELGAVRVTNDPSDLVTATVSDRDGRALQTWEDPDPAGSASQTSATTYDEDGRLLTAKDRRQVADGNLGWTFDDYDTIGRLVSVTEAEGSSPDIAAETRTTYDGLDRVTVTEVGYGSASSQRTELTLDLGGRVTETDDGFTCASATYDHRDLVLVREDSLDTSTCTANADSRETTNSYDALGRLLSTEVTDGPDDGDITSVVTYDAVGNALTSGDTTATVPHETTFEVNLLDQVLTEARDDGSTAKTTYDPVGNLLDQCTWATGEDVGDCLPVHSSPWTDPPTSSTSTRWDARNGRIGLDDSETNQTTVYDPDFNYQVSAVYLPVDPEQTKEHQSLYTYDTRYRLTGITHRLCTISTGHNCSATTTTGTDAYAYDDNDNRTTVNENNGNTAADYRYCYDARNQLTARKTASACTSSPTETNTYDEAGNRTQAVTAGPVTRNFAYTAAGLLCDIETGSAANCSGGNVTSDDAGRLSAYASYTYLYDAEGRLVSACNDADCVGSGFDRIDFTYDGEGHRTGITVDTGTPVETVFRYQGDAVVGLEVDGLPHHEYVTDPAGTIVKVIVLDGADAGTYLPIWNGHGDAMALYRVDGADLTLANSYTYDTWGQPTTATHNSVGDLGFRFLYVGAAGVQWDGTYGLGLTYMRARTYSPELGRFLQPDPSREDAQLFGYVDNNPVSTVDPSGKCPWCVIALLLVVGLAIDTIDHIATTPSTHRSVESWINHVWPGVAMSFIPFGRIFGIGGKAISAAARSFRLGASSTRRLVARYATNGFVRAYANVFWRGARGTTVLGRYPFYTTFARDLGARHLSINTRIWHAMSPTQRWAVNKAWLDAGRRRGDTFRLSTAPWNAVRGSGFAAELEYLRGWGYFPVYRNGQWVMRRY